MIAPDHSLHHPQSNGADGLGLAYYNEIDPFAAAWLRELIARNVIAPGIVDERSIEDVLPDELAGFTQCHFFAGIGVHSYALRRAGWADDRPIWTGSCPCQPFSAAGKGEGFADERHLWPAFYHLIEQCEPTVVAGEQVASGGTGVWFDLVQADLEAMGYAFGLVPLPAAGFGGAHIRDRAFWLADALRDGAKHDAGAGMGTQAAAYGGDGRVSRERLWAGVEGPFIGLGYASGQPRQRIAGSLPGAEAAVDGTRLGVNGRVADGFGNAGAGMGGMADAQRIRHDRSGNAIGPIGSESWRTDAARPAPLGHNGPARAPMLGRDAADWLFCRDGKWRPVGPGTFPLAHEAPARVGRLRGYGNAIDAETLTQFYAAVIGHLDGHPIAEAA
ncbi:MAG: DNA cytosine methyltransferase [Sphingobium sp.]